MTREKLASLKKYLQQCKDRLASPTPPKHAHREPQFRSYLEREIKFTSKAIDEALLK